MFKFLKKDKKDKKKESSCCCGFEIEEVKESVAPDGEEKEENNK